MDVVWTLHLEGDFKNVHDIILVSGVGATKSDGYLEAFQKQVEFYRPRSASILTDGRSTIILTDQQRHLFSKLTPEENRVQ
jgi:hypothetical protein